MKLNLTTLPIEEAVNPNYYWRIDAWQRMHDCTQGFNFLAAQLLRECAPHGCDSVILPEGMPSGILDAFRYEMRVFVPSVNDHTINLVEYKP